MYRFETNTPWGDNLHYFLKWTCISCFIGLLVGAVGMIFGYGVQWVTSVWKEHSWTLYLMPVSGVVIIWLYRTFNEEKNKGTNMVLEAISSNRNISFATAPLIFIGTLLTHIVAGSSGREGAALQLGGSLGNQIGRLLDLDEKDKKIAVMCGMSACFAALFGTPMAAGVFSMEVISIGIIYYAALVPCLFSAFIGAGIARLCGLAPEQFLIQSVPAFTPRTAVFTVILGMLCAVVSVLLCVVLHQSEHMYRKYFPNPYLRIIAASLIFILLTLMVGSRDYNGSGIHLIARCMEGESVRYEAFLMKMIFTGVVLGAGFKGGEIVPTMCVGATFGAAVGEICGFDPVLCAACGVTALFVGVTNCPIATVLLAFEMFGYGAMPYFSIIVAVSFTLSGYYGLYSSQKFIYSKIRTEYINIKSH
ncbi:chloride channel protein [Clostridium sp. AM58-1XD]|uniref:chloride channel protein n=1 Tax=Clostridium sp. AM58-1XD TaxID=2292307 RepID=UPI000E51027B|nr:chloride channel protein [Clostridium sp. AM58-1XD]RGZ01531.1 chloride channel protein [Clostridium sp. AM58-1XD]